MVSVLAGTWKETIESEKILAREEKASAAFTTAPKLDIIACRKGATLFKPWHLFALGDDFFY